MLCFDTILLFIEKKYWEDGHEEYKIDKIIQYFIEYEEI